MLHSLAVAGDLRELRLRYMDAAGRVFGARAWGFYLLDRRLAPQIIDVAGLPDSFVLRYEEVGRAVDPVMAHVTRHHAPAHELVVGTERSWHTSALYQHVSSRYGLEHIMTGPLVGSGRLVGTVNFGRARSARPFGRDDITRLGVLCAHLSACVAARRPEPLWLDSAAAAHLTPRELKIADLVALGRTNAGIAAELGIGPDAVKQALRRIFRKLDVGSRAEMVAQLRALPVQAPARLTISPK